MGYRRKIDEICGQELRRGLTRAQYENKNKSCEQPFSDHADLHLVSLGTVSQPITRLS